MILQCHDSSNLILHFTKIEEDEDEGIKSINHRSFPSHIEVYEKEKKTTKKIP